MIGGLYSAASAMLANLERQNVLSHNITNMTTPGFKQLLITLDDFEWNPVIYPPTDSSNATNYEYVGLLGLGVQTSAEETDFSPGGYKFTSNPLDLAIQSPGFFTVQTPDGNRYTRDGRFGLDTERQLVTVDGYFVLDTNGQPITVPEGQLSIEDTGAVLIDGEEVAQIDIAVFEDPATELTRDLPNTFSAAGEPTGEGEASVIQGYIEMSNADPTSLMTQMVAVARAYEAAQKLVQNEDELLGKTIATLGKL